jgi:23S rRNA (cytidine2498-2'-O)-methyltransferase
MTECGLPARSPCPGVVVLPSREALAAEATDFVFGRQVLPGAVLVEGGAIAKVAEGALSALLEPLAALDRPFRLHCLTPDDPVESTPGELARRVALVGEVLVQRLKERRRKVFRHYVAGAGAEPSCALVQLLLHARDRLFASVAVSARLPGGALWPSPFPAGRASIENDWGAPSSAFRKLEEALLWMGRAPVRGERCVDLGAAPGGWTHVALSRGATVTAVDRAALDARLARRSGLTQIKRDGFTFEPSDPPVDWLLCDLIAAPEKSLSLLSRWAEARWCKNLVFHLKFKGSSGYGLVKEVAPLLRAAGFGAVRCKHLFHDRNEVTVMASRDSLS